MVAIRKPRLHPGDIINGFEVIALTKNDKYKPLYSFRCLNCGKIVIKTVSQIRYLKCNGCKIINKTKKLFESLNDKICKGYKCIGYDLERRHISKHISKGVLIFECIHCGKTVKVSALNYYNSLKMCECKEKPRSLEKEIVGDFIIEPTNEYISNSRNLKYKATCQCCGHTLKGQHSTLVKNCKNGCKHHRRINEQCISKKDLKCHQKDEIIKKIGEIKDNTFTLSKDDNNLDLIWRDLNKLRRIETRMLNRLKMKYKNVIEEILIRLGKECK